MSKEKVIIEKWDDGTISAYVPDFEGFNLNGQGKDVAEAMEALREAVNDYKTMFESRGEEVPASLMELEIQ